MQILAVIGSFIGAIYQASIHVYVSNIGQGCLGQISRDYGIIGAHDANIPLIHEQYMDR